MVLMHNWSIVSLGALETLGAASVVVSVAPIGCSNLANDTMLLGSDVHSHQQKP
jgi:hypothetical protein